jgi:hypothetical protein
MSIPFISRTATTRIRRRARGSAMVAELDTAPPPAGTRSIRGCKAFLRPLMPRAALHIHPSDSFQNIGAKGRRNPSRTRFNARRSDPSRKASAAVTGSGCFRCPGGDQSDARPRRPSPPTRTNPALVPIGHQFAGASFAGNRQGSPVSILKSAASVNRSPSFASERQSQPAVLSNRIPPWAGNRTGRRRPLGFAEDYFSVRANKGVGGRVQDCR